LLNIQIDVQGALALFDRIFEYLDLPIEIHDKPKALQLKANAVRGEINFRDVSFTYKSDDYGLLKASPGAVQNGNSTRKILLQQACRVTDKSERRSTLSHVTFDINRDSLQRSWGQAAQARQQLPILPTTL